MNLIVTKDYDQLSAAAAETLVAHIRQQPDSVLVLPTGNTPLGMYRQLVQRAHGGEVSFDQAYLVELDEYLGIELDDPRNLYRWLDEVFITPAGFSPDRVFRFDSTTVDPTQEVARAEAALEAKGGIGLLVLGLGPNGHLGFNEPGSPFDSRTRAVDLTAESIESNARYWGGADLVPCCQALTLGLGTLSGARQTVLLVSGTAKADILAETLYGPIGVDVPATLLRQIDNVTVIADVEAASRLNGQPQRP
jgi:glucosamine-6-phosphate deaminase